MFMVELTGRDGEVVCSFYHVLHAPYAWLVVLCAILMILQPFQQLCAIDCPMLMGIMQFFKEVLRIAFFCHFQIPSWCSRLYVNL